MFVILKFFLVWRSFHRMVSFLRQPASAGQWHCSEWKTWPPSADPHPTPRNPPQTKATGLFMWERPPRVKPILGPSGQYNPWLPQVGSLTQFYCLLFKLCFNLILVSCFSIKPFWPNNVCIKNYPSNMKSDKFFALNWFAHNTDQGSYRKY